MAPWLEVEISSRRAGEIESKEMGVIARFFLLFLDDCSQVVGIEIAVRDRRGLPG